MEGEVMRFGLVSTADPDADPSFAAMALEARRRMKEHVRDENLSAYVELFDRDAYQSNISVAENLVFGTPRDPSLQPANLPRNPEVIALLRDVGLLDDFYAAGATVAGLMVELFADVAPDSPMFDQYSFISADDLPDFRLLVAKIGDGGLTRSAKKRRRGFSRSPSGSSSPSIGSA
jgi:putative ABC transport system ATP-binding protein